MIQWKNLMNFKEKQYDGLYEVSEVEFHIKNQIFNGLLYFPPESFQKPYSLIIYFHGFPQLHPLKEVVKSYQFLLDMGYAFLVFNFRGYNFIQGRVSISSQVSDSIKVVEFVQLMSRNNIFNINNVNIFAHGFGAYIALILGSKIKIINRLLLLTPIIDLERHINHIDFAKSLQYINRFLPGYIKAIEDVAGFIKMTRNELKNPEYQIIKVLKKLNYKKLRVIVGDKDKITPIDEIKDIVQKNVDNLEYVIIKNMSHDSFQEDYGVKIIEEIKNFFF